MNFKLLQWWARISLEPKMFESDHVGEIKTTAHNISISLAYIYCFTFRGIQNFKIYQIIYQRFLFAMHEKLRLNDFVS